MTDPKLENLLEESYRDHQKKIAILNFAKRLHLTLGQINELIAHPQHGAVVSQITLSDVVSEVMNLRGETNDPPPAKRKAKASGAKRPDVSKKAKVSKEKPSKKAKKTPKEKKAKGSNKADTGKPKPRLDYKAGMDECYAAIKAADKEKGPLTRAEVQHATGFSAVQTRTFLKRLGETNKIGILNPGTRAAKYCLPGRAA